MILKFICTEHNQEDYWCFKEGEYIFHSKRVKEIDDELQSKRVNPRPKEGDLMSIEDIKEKYGDIASIKEAVNTHNEKILIDTMSKIFIDEYNEEQNSVDHAILEGQDLARVDINYVAQRAAKKIIDSLDIKNI